MYLHIKTTKTLVSMKFFKKEKVTTRGFYKVNGNNERTRN